MGKNPVTHEYVLFVSIQLLSTKKAKKQPHLMTVSLPSAETVNVLI